MLITLRLVIPSMEIYYKDKIKIFLNSLCKTVHPSAVYSSKIQEQLKCLSIDFS